MDQQTDSYYIEQAQRGDTSSIGILASRHADRLYSMLLSMLQDHDEAKDLTQEVWLKVIKRIGQFRADSKFETWLYRIAYNEAIDYLRKKKKAPLRMEEERLGDSDMELDDNEGTEEKEYQIEALEAALAKLNAEDRMLVTLFYYDEKSLAEIAEIVNQTEGNCKVRLHRLRKKLYKLMQDHENRRQ